MLEAAPPTLPSVRAPVRDRLEEVRERVVGMLADDFGAVEEVNEHLLSMRGKLLRPTLLLLANEVGGSPREEAITMAAVVELVHVATLVHDDSVDHSVRRRGMPTLNERWTHQVAVIMGDYLYSRAVTESAAVGDVEAIEMLGRAANRMTVGEMRQLTSHEALDFDESDYDLLCECKTASLISTACELGAKFGVERYREPLASYGFRLGMAFQVTDDLLDYTASSRVTGKPTGQDLREHKVTLPLIAALDAMSPEERAEVEALFEEEEAGDSRVERVVEIVERRGGLEYARRRAGEHADRALEALRGLPSGSATEALQRAVHFVLERRS